MLRREEWFEDPLADVEWDPRALIGDRNHHLIALRRDVDPNNAVRSLCLRGIQQQIEEHGPELIGIRRDDGILARHLDGKGVLRRVAPHVPDGFRKQMSERHRRELGLPRPREHEQVLHDGVQRIEPRDDVPDDGLVAALGRQPAANHLQGAADPRDRVLHLVRHDGRHLAKTRQRGLLAELGLRLLPIGDVVANRHVLVRLPPLVQEGHDRGIDPVVRAVLRAVADFPSPDPSVRDRVPQVADELLRVRARVDDPVILAEQLVSGVLRDLEEPIVGVCDPSLHVGRRNDRGLVEREIRIGQVLDRPLQRASDDSFAVLVDQPGRDPHAGQRQRAVHKRIHHGAARR